MNYDTIEKTLLGQYPKLLYLEGYTHDPNMPLESFLDSFLTKNSGYHELYKTMNPEKPEMVHCGKSRLRTQGDIFLIARNYYPSCTFEEIKKFLIDNKWRAWTTFCPDINKQTFRLNPKDFATRSSREFIYHLRWSWGCGHKDNGGVDEYGLNDTI